MIRTRTKTDQGQNRSISGLEMGQIRARNGPDQGYNRATPGPEQGQTRAACKPDPEPDQVVECGSFAGCRADIKTELHACL